MIYVLSFFISLYTCLLYVNRNYSAFLFTLLLCSFSVLEPNLDIIGLDYITIRAIGQNSFFFSVIFILIIRKLKYNRSIKPKNIIDKIVLVIFLYSFIISCVTIATGKESVFNVIALMKPYTILLSIFILKDIGIQQYIKSLNNLFIFTFFAGIIAILQVVLDFNLFGQTVVGYSEGIDRYWSPYSLAAFCLFMSLTIKKRNEMFYFLFFLILVILPLRRGLIISTFLTLVIFFIYQLKNKHVPKGFFVLLLISFFSFPILVNRFTSEGDNAKSDLSGIVSGEVNYSHFRSGVDGGSFMFRIAVLMERIDYVLNDPKDFLMGVGMIHEDTAQKTFSFYLGSRKTVNGEITVQQIDTTDIVWPPILMRMGAIGIFLYFLLFVVLLSFYVRNIKDSRWALAGSCFLFSLLIYSIADAQLTNFHSILIFYIIYRIVQIESNKTVDRRVVVT